MKRYTSSTLKYVKEIDTFSDIGPHKMSYVLSRSQYGHIKTIFSFCTGTGKHFIGNALCSSDDSVMKLIHILHFLATNIVFYQPLK